MLRLAEVVNDEADGLGREELGTGREVAVLKRLVEVAAAVYPTVQTVERHMRVGTGEVQQGQFRLGITADFELRHVLMKNLVFFVDG